MDFKCANELITALSKKLNISNTWVLHKIVNYLNKSTLQIYNDKISIFEFSFVSKEENIRMLHRLKSCSQKAHLSISNISTGKEINSIVSLMESLNGYLGSRFNIDIARRFLSVSYGMPWTIGFGFEVRKNRFLKIKIYIFIPMPQFNQKAIRYIFDRIEHVCCYLNLDAKIIRRKFLTDFYFDTIGVDFLPDGKASFKIYTFHHNPKWAQLLRIYKRYHILGTKERRLLRWFVDASKKFAADGVGFTYRISSNSTVSSIKMWARLLSRISPEDLYREWVLSNTLTDKKLDNWYEQTANLIKRTHCAISYLALEGKENEIYIT